MLGSSEWTVKHDVNCFASGEGDGAARAARHRAFLRRGRLRVQPAPPLLRTLPLRRLHGNLGRA